MKGKTVQSMNAVHTCEIITLLCGFDKSQYEDAIEELFSEFESGVVQNYLQILFSVCDRYRSKQKL